MKMRYLLILLTLVIITKVTYPQKSGTLKIGDKVPDIKFEMVNSKSATLSLSDLKGKYVILDFWATWCTSCIHKFPELDSLQQVFKEKLRIVLVNSKNTQDTRRKAVLLFSKYKTFNKIALGLPSAVNDSVAFQYFKYKSIPHYVWIDAEGVVSAITSANEITSENIRKFISGEQLNLRQKSDMGNQQNAGYFNKDASEIKFKSMFTGYLDGVSDMKLGGGYSGEKISRFCLVNTSILMMYKIAFKNYFYNNRLVVEGLDRAKLIEPERPKGWKYDNTYCYELIASPRSRNEMLELFREDLVRFFGITATTEKRTTECLIISKKGNNAVNEVSRFPLFEGRFIELEDVKTVNDLASFLDTRFEIPVLDETDSSALTLLNDITDLEHLKMELNSRGFLFKKEKREIEVLVMKKVK